MGKQIESTDFAIEHPSGSISVSTSVRFGGKNWDDYSLVRAEFIRTARPLFEGNVFVPSSVMELKEDYSDKISSRAYLKN